MMAQDDAQPKSLTQQIVAEMLTTRAARPEFPEEIINKLTELAKNDGLKKPQSVVASIKYAYMVDRDQLSQATYAWELPYLHKLPESLQADLHHARRLSEAMYGASLLYNVLLARLQGNDEWIYTYERLFVDWAALITDRQADFRAWHRDLNQFWPCAALKH